jgi:hypothetical protein
MEKSDTQRQFSDIQRLKSTADLNEANKLLNDGWQLLNVLTRRDEYEFTEYVLGLPKERLRL